MNVLNYRVITFPLFSRSALTLPIPFGGALILVGRKRDWLGDESLRRHELCHVAQIERMGTIKYLLVHIWARIKTRDIYAVNDPIEKECYDAGRTNT